MVSRARSGTRRADLRLNDEPLRFSVVVPTRGRAERLLPLFDALADQSLPRDRFEILLAFDGLAAPNDIAARAPSGTRLVTLPERRGPGAARNEAARLARGDWLAFTEDDCRPARDWLERADRRIRSREELDVIEGETVIPGGGPVRRRDGDLPNYLPTNLFVRRDLFRGVGGYCERYFDAARGIYFREDSDFGFSLEAAGARVGFDPEIRVTHPREHAGFLDPLTWARRYEMDALLERRHPERFRERIEVARLGPLRLRRVVLRASFAYVTALLAAAAAFGIGERGLGSLLLLLAALALLPVWAKWGFQMARLPLVPLVPIALVASYLRGLIRMRQRGAGAPGARNR